MRSVSVSFDLDDVESERAFLETYMMAAWDRFQAHEALDCAWFWRYGNTSQHGTVQLEGGETLEGGGVILVVNGDPTPEPIVDAEKPRWKSLEDDGVLRGWDTNWFRPEYENARAKAVENFGPVGGEWAYRMRPLVSRFTLDVVAEFDERLPPVGDRTDANPLPVGFWATIHFTMKQHGYDWYDETEACVKAIENRLQSLAAFHGVEAARDQLDALLADLEAVEVDG